MGTEPLDTNLLPRDVLPCPSCGTVNDAPVVTTRIETVSCKTCRKVLASRPALTTEQRAQTDILRAAARRLEDACETRFRSGKRCGDGDSREIFDDDVRYGAELLRQWSRTIHKRPRAK